MSDLTIDSLLSRIILEKSPDGLMCEVENEFQLGYVQSITLFASQLV